MSTRLSDRGCAARALGRWPRWPLWRIAALLTAWCSMGAAWAQVEVADAWVRGTVEGQDATGAYMTLRSQADVRLIGVSSPDAARGSVHAMTMDGNVMRMRELASMPVAAGRAVELSEGGNHLMLEGLKHPLKAGDHVALTLTFADAGGRRWHVEVHAPVQPLGAPAPGHAHSSVPMPK